MRSRVDKFGRILIPKEIRKEFSFDTNDYVEIDLIEDRIIISKPQNIDKEEKLDFLIKRERKLQDIEYILMNDKSVDISDIRKILNI